MKFCQALFFREMPTFPCKFNHNLCFSSFLKADIAGITGPVQFDENGRRIVSRLDIVNLRNDSFKRVSSMTGMNNPILFSAFFIETECFKSERKSLDWISTTTDIRKAPLGWVFITINFALVSIIKLKSVKEHVYLVTSVITY